MAQPESWRELYRCDDLDHARMVATCLVAMEFEARLMDSRGTLIESNSQLLHDSPFVIHVPSGDWAMLIEVLPEIIDEQLEFDTDLRGWRCRAAQRERIWLVLLVAIVIVLAMFGLIEL